MTPLPSALQSFESLLDEVKDKRLVLFLDYDGTLTPIVAHPEDAMLSAEMRQTLKEVSQRHVVAVVSGRDRADVAARIGLANLIYAGSHGFDISGPDGLRREHPEGRTLLDKLDDAEVDLEEALADIAGAQVDRKKYAIAVHYRNVDPSDVSAVEAIVDEHLKHYEEFEKKGGKKVFELKPRIDWHKGKAVLWLMKALGLENSHIPIYLGDDVTDEDAFKALSQKGIGVLVGSAEASTAARYRLHDHEEVRYFLQRL